MYHVRMYSIFYLLCHILVYLVKPGESLFNRLETEYDKIINVFHPKYFMQLQNIKDNNNLPVPEMVQEYGYEAEIYKVITDDGYINTLHRLKSPKNSSTLAPILVQHGLFGTSADFVMGRPDKSIGYILADIGYDVWLGNSRGNIYSRNHVNLTVNDDDYWKFSFDEMGKYDLPAAISLIKNVSHSDQIYYIGHSMGTVMFWIAMEDNPILNNHIKLMIAMGPVAKVTHVVSPIRHLAPFSKDFKFLMDLLGINEISPSNAILNWFDKWVCDLTMIQKEVCENLLFLMSGYDFGQMNMTLLPIILGHEPGGTSTRTLIHFAQEINDDKFQKFDHGKAKNVIFYNSTVPPQYDVKKSVKVPVALLWSDNDWLADPSDVYWLKEQLSNVLIKFYEVPLKKFNHIDFLWGLDADKLVYPVILDLLEKMK
uniref:Lipase n=1 Tax=Lepeophtheirus salmonis TaxID=72036 RepID=A0A0K2THP6_LEPSM